MKLSDYNYHLPKSFIATEPLEYRDTSRLMVLNRKEKTIEHRQFSDIVKYFDEGDVLIINDTKVFPAILSGEKEKTNAKITVFLLRELNVETRLWDVLVDPARKIRIGNKLYFGENSDLVAEVIDNTTSRGRTLRFLFDGPYEEFKRIIFDMGKMPVPEEIQLLRSIKDEDSGWYQTEYAKNEGAVVAPSAGFHFSRQIMKRLELNGATFAPITLHGGVGNFRPIDVEDLTKHKMDSEEAFISPQTADIVNKAKTEGKNICVVGTTTMKAIESSVAISGYLKPFSGWTNKFIYPPYNFSVPTSMLTNFHLPCSPMLIMVSAFADFKFLMQAYKEAIDKNYRFFTYGDAMLIL